MGNRALKFIALVFLLTKYYDLTGQCYVSRFSSNIKDSCKTFHVYSRFTKAMRLIGNTKNIGTIWIYNKNRPIELPENLKNMDLYALYMNKCLNDSIILSLKNLGSLSYETDTLNVDVINYTQLVTLSIRYKYGNLENIIRDSNNLFHSLELYSRTESLLDSSLILCKRLHSVSFCFNPFLTINYNILKNINRLTGISIRNMDFRKYSITETELKRLSVYRLWFFDCKFTKEQKKQLKDFKNLEFN